MDGHGPRRRAVLQARGPTGHHPEAARWLTEHAHEAINTGQRTLRGDRLYRLAHPWDGPDAVLVVSWTRTTPAPWSPVAGGTRPPLTRRRPPPGTTCLKRVGATAAPRPHDDGARVAVILDAPSPPDGLPCPPGSLDLSAILPGYSLDTDALSRADIARWVDYARLVRIHLANHGHGTAAALAK